MSNFENVSMVDRTNQKRDCIVNAIAVDGIGNVYFINKIPVFVDDMNLRKSGVYHCLRGTKKTHNKFRKTTVSRIGCRTCRILQKYSIS